VVGVSRTAERLPGERPSPREKASTRRLGGARGRPAEGARGARDVAMAVTVVCGIGAGLRGRRPGLRTAFLGVLVVAAVDVALLVGSGSALR
jgi:hypothetical protein